MLNDRENILNQQGALQSQPPVIAEGGRGLSLSLSIIHADPRGLPHCCVTWLDALLVQVHRPLPWVRPDALDECSPR